jgi:cytochrome c553
MQIVKRLLLTIGVLLIVVVTAAYGVTSYRIAEKVEFTDTVPVVDMNSGAVARGEYLVRAIAKCGDCHGADLGGQVVVDDAALGRFFAPNLTMGRDGVAAVASDAAIVNAFRHGVARDGRKLMFMPARDYSVMADEDAAAIVAYIRSVPPVDRASETSRVGPLGRALYLAGQLPLFEAELFPHDDIVRRTPPAGVTPEYGRYLANIGGCTGCHGPTLSGGKIPGTPPEFKPAANLTPAGLGHYTEADFFRALREGTRPDGSTIDPFMPVSATKLMTDDDTRAIWQYLQTVPAKAYGGR